MKEIPLTQGKHALVDDEDYDFLMQWKWCLHSAGYAVRRTRKSEGLPKRMVFLHRVIAKAREEEEVDHANGMKLDNQRANLRIATSGQNKHNRPAKRNNKLGVKGVCVHQNSFRARIQVNGKTHDLGCFPSLSEAAKVYAEAAREFYGEFAKN